MNPMGGDGCSEHSGAGKAAIAFAKGGATDRTATSPTPVGDSVYSIRCTSISGTERIRTIRIAVEVLNDDLAAVTQHHLTPRRRAEPEQELALDLSADQIRVDSDAAVEHVHDPIHANALGASSEISVTLALALRKLEEVTPRA